LSPFDVHIVEVQRFEAERGKDEWVQL